MNSEGYAVFQMPLGWLWDAFWRLLGYSGDEEVTTKEQASSFPPDDPHDDFHSLSSSSRIPQSGLVHEANVENEWRKKASEYRDLMSKWFKKSEDAHARGDHETANKHAKEVRNYLAIQAIPNILYI